MSLRPINKGFKAIVNSIRAITQASSGISSKFSLESIPIHSGISIESAFNGILLIRQEVESRNDLTFLVFHEDFRIRTNGSGIVQVIEQIFTNLLFEHCRKLGSQRARQSPDFVIFRD